MKSWARHSICAPQHFTHGAHTPRAPRHIHEDFCLHYFHPSWRPAVKTNSVHNIFGLMVVFSFIPSSWSGSRVESKGGRDQHQVFCRPLIIIFHFSWLVFARCRTSIGVYRLHHRNFRNRKRDTQFTFQIGCKCTAWR